MNLHARSWKEPFLEAVFWGLILSSLVIGYVGWIRVWWWLMIVGWAALVVLVYGGFIEPLLLRVVTYRVGERKVGEGEQRFRLVFISDLHAGMRKREGFYRRIAERTRTLQPDMVILGGDLVNEVTGDVIALKPIFDFKPPKGLWLVLGNHDFMDDPKKLVKTVAAQGVRDLTNQSLTFGLSEDRSLEIVGLDDSWFGMPNLKLVEKPKQGTRIVVTHEPDLLLDLPEGCADLILLGHTHGGQIRIPLRGPLVGLPQAIPKDYDAGEKIWKNMRVIISRGVAETLVRARLGARPEIIVVDVA